MCYAKLLIGDEFSLVFIKLLERYRGSKRPKTIPMIVSLSYVTINILRYSDVRYTCTAFIADIVDIYHPYSVQLIL